MELKNFDIFMQIAKSKPKKKIAVAAAEDAPVLQAVAAARREGIVEPILIGNATKIKELAKDIKFELSDIEIIEENEPSAASRKAVQVVREGRAHILMKGLVSSPDFLRAVLNKEIGLRKGDLLSHIGFFEIPAYHKVLAITDAAQNISLTLDEKVSVIKNCLDLYSHLGVECPKIAVIAAAETISTKMESTLHASALTMMNRRNQLKNCLIDGPLGFDNAISKESAIHKGIVSDVAGDADLLLAPEINVANAVYKSFTYFGGATVAALILGATVPIVLTSRSDTDRSKLYSLALAASY